MVDGNMNEAAWNGVQEYLIFGPKPATTIQMQGVTSGVWVKTDVPYVDTTWTKVKFTKLATKLYIGFSSDDKSVCKFGDSWEVMVFYENKDRRWSGSRVQTLFQ